jgi:hypothetical protein
LGFYIVCYRKSSCRAIFRSEQSGSVCDTLSLEDKFCYEKIHNKYCKYNLGLKKIACNISAKSELGRFPITDYIKTQAILYFSRLQNRSNKPSTERGIFSLEVSLKNESFSSGFFYYMSHLLLS